MTLEYSSERLHRYHNECFITWNDTVDYPLALLNAFLGLSGEFVELYDALVDLDDESKEPAIGEFGDVLYYLSILYALVPKDQENFVEFMQQEIINAFYYRKNTNENLKIIESRVYSELFLMRSFGYMSEVLKKYIFHGKEFNFSLFAIYLRPIILWYFNSLYEMKYSFIDVMEYNYNKLKARYPEGFKKLENV